MNTLACLEAYNKKESYSAEALRPLTISLVTNFTDEVLERILGGKCLLEGLYPTIMRAPYKQYAFALKDQASALYATKPDITFFFFDISPYIKSEFSEPEHADELCQDIRNYCRASSGTVVVSLPLFPYRSAYGHFFKQDPLFIRVHEFVSKLEALAAELPQLHLCDTNKVAHSLGERHIRDPRGEAAFDMPFTSDFLFALCHEWFAYIYAITGQARKCIVLDLDNTLWGGVVGEAGPLGVELGPQYPGSAFQNFQRTLLKMWERGVLLALNSKNNLADVEEIFEKNPHMILNKDHFAAIRANWEDKASNLRSIAKELNIGLDSLVFLDDSPLERELVRLNVPEVFTPDMPQAPEEYTRLLLSLNVFHQMALTDEDKKKGRMYAEERKRREVLESSKSVEDYIANLNLEVWVALGKDINVARAAQLTQKTNQLNLTTKRYSEGDIERLIAHDDVVMTGEVRDKFGHYGIVLVAIVTGREKPVLDTFLMSCRVMGRGVEKIFFNALAQELRSRGASVISASYIPTKKNAPARDLLPSLGAQEVSRSPEGEVLYTLTV